MRIKTHKREKVIYLVICVLRFGLVAFLCFWCFWCEQRLFLKKKEFKTALITSFTLLLKIYLVTSMNFFNHNHFQLLQSFSIITIFFNYHNLFQLLQSFSIIKVFFITIFFITIFFITVFFNLFATCDTVFMKIRQCTNSII